MLRLLLLYALLPLAVPAQSPSERPQEILNRAVAHFRASRIKESVAAFDKVAALVPDYAPQLWQRGIALYYIGRYKDCRRQFESHRKVNPNDVENAAWHFLCVARSESPEKAKAALLPVGPDSRVPMTEIYQMLRGVRTPEQVLAAADSQLEAQFYAHFYVGLYYEALGDPKRAQEHMSAAAEDRYAAAGDYMHMVAQVHVRASRKPVP